MATSKPSSAYRSIRVHHHRREPQLVLFGHHHAVVAQEGIGEGEARGQGAQVLPLRTQNVDGAILAGGSPALNVELSRRMRRSRAKSGARYTSTS